MIIFDLDHTLFNTTLLKQDMLHVFEKYEIRGQDFWKSLYKSYDLNPDEIGVYSIERHLTLLKDLTSKQKQQLKRELELTMSDRGQAYLFPDVLPTLIALRDKGITTMLLAKGNKGFKQLKIDITDLSRYFTKIFFCSREVLPQLKKIMPKSDNSEDVVVISGNLSMLVAIKEKFSAAVCIFIRREDEAVPKDISIISVNNLTDIHWLLKNIGK